jgi:hypothetical protein
LKLRLEFSGNVSSVFYPCIFLTSQRYAYYFASGGTNDFCVLIFFIAPTLYGLVLCDDEHPSDSNTVMFSNYYLTKISECTNKFFFNFIDFFLYLTLLAFIFPAQQVEEGQEEGGSCPSGGQEARA